MIDRIYCLVMACALCAAGCSRDGATGEGPFGPPQRAAILEQFQGKWVCDRDKTYAVWSEQGKQTAVEATKKIEEAFSANPQLAGVQLPHPNIAIDGNSIVGDGVVSQEYDLFALHKHGDVVCGKAWHHEDRHDPGDMSKVWVRLSVVGNELHLCVKHDEPLDGVSANVADPDFVNFQAMRELQVEGDASRCETANDDVRSEMWTTYVFARSGK
jgi:hypothetical protein